MRPNLDWVFSLNKCGALRSGTHARGETYPGASQVNRKSGQRSVARVWVVCKRLRHKFEPKGRKRVAMFGVRVGRENKLIIPKSIGHLAVLSRSTVDAGMVVVVMCFPVGEVGWESTVGMNGRRIRA